MNKKLHLFILIIPLLINCPLYSDEGIDQDFLAEKLEQANNSIVHSKTNISEKEKTDSINEALTNVRDIFDNYSNINKKTLIRRRHEIFNLLMAIANSNADNNKALNNPTLIEVEKYCYKFADDKSLPLKFRQVAWQTLATLSVESCDSNKTLIILENMLRTFSDEKADVSHVFFNLGKMSESLASEANDSNFIQQASDIYDYLINNIPDLKVKAESRARRANIYLNERKNIEAIKEYEAIISMKNLNPYWQLYSLFNIGCIYMRDFKLDEADKIFQRMIDDYPLIRGWHVMALRKKAEIFIAKNDRKKALETYNYVLENYSDSPLVETVKSDIRNLNETEE